MKLEEKIKMFKDVFAPKKGEKVLFLIDLPHDDIKDTDVWKARRDMAEEWCNIFEDMGGKKGFTVEMDTYEATGVNNKPLDQEVIDKVSKYNLIIAMTQFSATSTLFPICQKEGSKSRGASMPGVEKAMEETALRADYSKVQKYATSIKKMLDDSVGAKVTFSTGDKIYIDLRNREAEADKGECKKAGQFINFPSGEGFKVPYEAVDEEKDKFGRSITEGILPMMYEDYLIKLKVVENKIIDIIGPEDIVKKLTKFFDEAPGRRNIAELGIGCNPEAIVRGLTLEDEKVGLHIAYGMSAHLHGKVKSDLHIDIVYAKGCPIEGTTLTLFNKDGWSSTELIKNSKLRYNLLV